MAKDGDCRLDSDWKLKAKARKGRIKVKFKVDSDESGQRWRYSLKHNGDMVDSGMRTTGGDSDSSSRRTMPIVR